ncbi:MAG: hypothetical protein ACR2JU_11645 [Nocardioidaceae bacterium]
MRWTDLFADLEAEVGALERSELHAEVADRTRAEVGQVTLLNRLRSDVGSEVSLRLSGAVTVVGTLERVGADWLLVTSPNEVVVPMAAVSSVANLPLDAVSPEGLSPVASRLTFSSALRAIAVDRARVTVMLTDGTTVAGTPDRVGHDFLDIAVHHLDEAPRSSAVTMRTTVAYAAITRVTRESRGWA